jgi:hypothetical protein
MMYVRSLLVVLASLVFESRLAKGQRRKSRQRAVANRRAQRVLLIVLPHLDFLLLSEPQQMKEILSPPPLSSTSRAKAKPPPSIVVSTPNDTSPYDADSTLSSLEDVELPSLKRSKYIRSFNVSSETASSSTVKRPQHRATLPATSARAIPSASRSSAGRHSLSNSSQPPTPSQTCKATPKKVAAKLAEKKRMRGWAYETILDDGTVIPGKLDDDEEIAQARRKMGRNSARADSSSEEEEQDETRVRRLRRLTPARSARASSSKPRIRQSLPSSFDKPAPPPTEVAPTRPASRPRSSLPLSSNVVPASSAPPRSTRCTFPGLPYQIALGYFYRLPSVSDVTYRAHQTELGPFGVYPGELPSGIVTSKESISRREMMQKRARYEIGRLLKIEQLRRTGGRAGEERARRTEELVREACKEVEIKGKEMERISMAEEKVEKRMETVPEPIVEEVVKAATHAFSPISASAAATASASTSSPTEADLALVRSKLFLAAFPCDNRPIIAISATSSSSSITSSSASTRPEPLALLLKQTLNTFALLPTPSQSSKSDSPPHSSQSGRIENPSFSCPLPDDDDFKRGSEFALSDEILSTLSNSIVVGKKRKRVPRPYKLIEKSQFCPYFPLPRLRFLMAGFIISRARQTRRTRTGQGSPCCCLPLCSSQGWLKERLWIELHQSVSS